MAKRELDVSFLLFHELAPHTVECWMSEADRVQNLRPCCRRPLLKLTGGLHCSTFHWTSTSDSGSSPYSNYLWAWPLRRAMVGYESAVQAFDSCLLLFPEKHGYPFCLHVRTSKYDTGIRFIFILLEGIYRVRSCRGQPGG